MEPKNRKTTKPRVKKEHATVQEENNVAEVIITRNYFDTRFNKKIPKGEEFECSIKRAKELTEAKVAEVIKLKK